MVFQPFFSKRSEAGSDTELRVGDFLAPSLSRVTQEHAWRGWMLGDWKNLGRETMGNLQQRRFTLW